MKASQIIVVGGTLNGKREVFPALPANSAMVKYYELKRLGYSQLTMTDATTGHDYDVGKFLAPAPQRPV